MDSDLLESQMQYIERNGCCLNIEEKMRLALAFQELKTDLDLSAISLTAKITGKHFPLTVTIILLGVIKDYFLCQVKFSNDKIGQYWCSSSSWVFSELPKVSENAADVLKLKQINTFFSGEFDQVLYQNTAPPTVIDADLGVFMQAKPVTELDRLSFVYNQICLNQVRPKGWLKYTPAQKFEHNEAFSGLSK
jgi:hypothetical protein